MNFLFIFNSLFALALRLLLLDSFGLSFKCFVFDDFVADFVIFTRTLLLVLLLLLLLKSKLLDPKFDILLLDKLALKSCCFCSTIFLKSLFFKRCCGNVGIKSGSHGKGFSLKYADFKHSEAVALYFYSI